MLIYRELYFRAKTEQDLFKFKKLIEGRRNNIWEISIEKIAPYDYIVFEYKGDSLNSAKAYVVIENNCLSWHVCNVVPLKQSRLSYSEYNALVVNLYETLKTSLISDIDFVDIELSRSDEFDINSVLSSAAAKKLEVFSNAANKSTGSAHPCDQERWFDFICQTFDDQKFIDTGELIRYLIEDNNWSEDVANKLGLEYEYALDILKYYKNNY